VRAVGGNIQNTNFAGVVLFTGVHSVGEKIIDFVLGIFRKNKEEKGITLYDLAVGDMQKENEKTKS
jgi:hypothetical protein